VPIDHATAAAAVGSETYGVFHSDMTAEQMEQGIHAVPTLCRKVRKLRRKQKNLVGSVALLRERMDDLECVLDDFRLSFFRYTKKSGWLCAAVSGMDGRE
jgi:hypothetical protein